MRGPATLTVVVAAGHVFEGAIGAGETVRIMTGAPVPEGADAVVKYEIVDVLDGDGNEGSRVRFSAPAKVGEARGPPRDSRRDKAGNGTAAAIGFAKKQGLEPDQLQVFETPKGSRLGLISTVKGADTSASINDIVNASIQHLPIPKRMRWGASRVEFVRPAHWVVAMLGTRWDHGEILGLPTGNTTRGHRFHSSGSIVLKRPEDYREALANAKVVASFEQRREMIRDQVEVEASAIKATAVMDENLLDEVTGLVEWPVALTGSFEARFLEVPAEALVSSMKEHQKYFHLVDAQGKLMPNFITIANIESKDPVQVIAGNERVIRPRLSDAAFFFATDKKTRLEQLALKHH